MTRIKDNRPSSSKTLQNKCSNNERFEPLIRLQRNFSFNTMLICHQHVLQECRYLIHKLFLSLSALECCYVGLSLLMIGQFSKKIQNTQIKWTLQGEKSPLSYNALDRIIIHAIFRPLFQVIQRCSLHWKGHIDDLYDIHFTRNLEVNRVSF